MCKNKPRSSKLGAAFCFHFAEGTRFELVVQNNPYGSLANCWFQPLTHPSGNDVPETPAIQAGLQRYIILFSSQGGLLKKWRNRIGKVHKSEKSRKFATYFAVVSLDAGNCKEILVKSKQ